MSKNLEKFIQCAVIILLATLFVPGCSSKASTEEGAATDNSSSAGASVAAERLQPKDFVYQGAFRLPDGPEEYAWLYSGQGLTYYPEGDPKGADDGTPGSLFGIGHDWHQYVSEISIPKPVVSKTKNLEELNTAATLQPFANVRGNLYPGDLEQARSDIEYLPAQGSQKSAKLYFCWGPHMHDSQAVPSHGMCELNLKNPRPVGPWKFGDLWTYLTCDYIFSIDPAWASKNTPGMLLATGRFRDGGQGSLGPALFAYGPWNDGDPPGKGASLKATPLLRYASVYDGEAGATHKLKNYHHSDDWAGGAWLTSGDRAAVIFVGTKGKGKCWYGFANGVVWPEEGPWPEVPPYPNDQRGWWSSKFAGQMLFYDPNDFAAVIAGNKEAWEPQPYATMDLDPVLFGVTPKKMRHVGDVTFDRKRGLVYMVEFRGDGDKSLIHVWKVANGEGSSAQARERDKETSSATADAAQQETAVAEQTTPAETAPDTVSPVKVSSAAFVVDHNCIDAKDNRIPIQYLDKARQIDFYFGHQSIGFNIVEGLEQLQEKNSKRYALSIVEGPASTWFDTNNGLGHFQVGENYNPSAKIKHFYNQMANKNYGQHVQAAAMKFCYVDIEANTEVPKIWSEYRDTMEKLSKKFPQVRFVWITCPVVVSGDNTNRNAMNKLVRNYCSTHKKILFDLADIEAHSPQGKPSRHAGQPSLFKAYSVDGEHPDADAGKQRLARGWWWLTARLAGWSG